MAHTGHVRFDQAMNTRQTPSTIPRPADGRQIPGLAAADRTFRLGGAAALLLLLATVGLALAGVGAWRPVFTAAHIAALVALLPLSFVMTRYAFARARADGRPGIRGVMHRYRGTVALLVLVAIAVAISLANFDDGNRTLRRLANYTTVAAALVLVARYLRWTGRRAS